MSYFYIPPLKIPSLDFYLTEIGKPKSLKCPTSFYIICRPPTPALHSSLDSPLFTFSRLILLSHIGLLAVYQVNRACLHLKIFALPGISSPLNTHMVPSSQAIAKLQERGSIRRQAQMGLDSLLLMEQQAAHV